MLVSVTAVGILLGGFYILLAIPIASVLATLVDVVLRNVDPAESLREEPAVPPSDSPFPLARVFGGC